MSKRLQVLLPDQEMEDIQRLARSQKMTVGEWVRQSLREVTQSKPATDAESKLLVIRKAAEYSFPSGDISEILGDINRSYTS